MLMLPEPRRGFDKCGVGQPVAREKAYVLTKLGCSSESEVNFDADLVTIFPTHVELANATDREVEGVSRRVERIKRVYEASYGIQGEVANLIHDHEDLLKAGSQIDETLTAITRALIAAVSKQENRVCTDPLETLEAVFSITPPLEPLLPTPDALPEEDAEVRARSAAEYRLRKIRGASAQAFRARVNEAYRGRCIFCGAVFGGKGVNSGVDAAHILAWSKYDLDVVSNGILLCKNHHWAFDAGILVPRRSPNGSMSLAFTELSCLLDERSLSLLGNDGFVIPDEWMPEDRSAWPDERLLRRLHADLAVTFISDW